MSLRRWAPLALAALSALALAGCETTAEKSAKLEEQAKRVTLQQEKGLTIAHESTSISVTSAAIVRDGERAAAVVTLQNRSAEAQRDVPLAITVRDAQGRTVYQNSEPGLEGALVAVPSIPAHASVTWVDDQLQPTGTPASVSARVGQAPSIPAAPPSLTAEPAKLGEEPATGGVIAEGTVLNRSKVAQRELVVYAVARKGAKVVAAGRAIVAELAPGSSAPYQASLVGDAHGASLRASAPAASFG